MPNGQVDPARLEGEALRRWYLRTPDEVREERWAAEGVRYGNLYAPASDDLVTLRRQQAEFEQKRREISKENSWMAVPALAPAAAVLGLEAGAAIAARLVPQAVTRGPLMLTERMPYLRVGQNWATRAGQRADKFYKEMARAKEGWQPEPRVPGPNGTTLKPDIGAPRRTPDPAVRKYIEVKPNTPQGGLLQQGR